MLFDIENLKQKMSGFVTVYDYECWILASKPDHVTWPHAFMWGQN